MLFKKCFVAILFAVATVGISNNAQAGLIDYSGYGISFDIIAPVYGDTASVDVTHTNRTGMGNTPISDFARFWTTGYGSLTDVCFGGSGSSTDFGEIRFDSLTANPVTLNSFDLAGYLFDQTPVDLRVFDGSYNLLWSLDDQTIPGATGFASYSPNISASSVIVQWENAYNVAIDNISFSSVPEPGSLGLGIFGFAAMFCSAVCKRRRR